jgi:hypothetical protein
LASPFNTVAELIAFTSFREGDADSIDRPAFKRSQFESALQLARNEIDVKTLSAELTEERESQCKEAELYLATSRLYRLWGERLGLLTTDANLVGVGSVSLGADTPPPTGLNSKMDFWLVSMSQEYRRVGLSILNGQPFAIGLGHERPPNGFPALLRAGRNGHAAIHTR